MSVWNYVIGQNHPGSTPGRVLLYINKKNSYKTHPYLKTDKVKKNRFYLYWSYSTPENKLDDLMCI